MRYLKHVLIIILLLMPFSLRAEEISEEFSEGKNLSLPACIEKNTKDCIISDCIHGAPDTCEGDCQKIAEFNCKEMQLKKAD